jgi:hypothetical protein
MIQTIASGLYMGRIDDFDGKAGPPAGIALIVVAIVLCVLPFGEPQ